MRTTIQALLITTVALLVAPGAASADFAHTVTRGESLSSVAAADGLSVSALAAANGMSTNSQLTSGSTLQIPPQGTTGEVTQAQTAAPASTEFTSAPVSSAPASTSSGSGGYVVRPGDTLSAIAAANGISVRELAAENGLSPSGVLEAGATLSIGGSSAGTAAAPSTSSTAPSSAGSGSGGYVVQPGDTLSSIAAASGMSVRELAAENGLSPSGILEAGATLSVPGAQAASSAPVASSSSSGAQPTAETVSPADVGQVAADSGVSSSFAQAIADQESGFNNDLVSPTGAVGVMQIEPGTWNYIGRNLGPVPPLSPTSAQDNVRGGVLLLHSLLDQTGGDPSLAAAGYFQGLASVRQNGMLPSTQQYVSSVMALRNRFGGP